jgi:hypothetical protein
MEVDMSRQGFWVVISLAVGLLQVWDSGGFASGPFVAVLSAAGIALPAAAIAARVSHEVRIAALVVGAILLVGARLAAPVSLNGLHLALFPAALYILFLRGIAFDGHQQSA